MPFNFTFLQRAELSALLAAANDAENAALALGQNPVGTHTPVYDYIMEAISVGTSVGQRPEIFQRNPDVDADVWLWVRGATDVNRGNGFFADFIRDWTEVQYEARYGQPLTSDIGPAVDEIQLVSNDIARNFATDIITSSTGALPDISQTGRVDAGSVAAIVYEGMNVPGYSNLPHTGNYTPWAGTLLFSYFGYTEFTSDWLFTLDKVDADASLGLAPSIDFRALDGTYDIVAAAYTSAEVSDFWAAIANRAALSETLQNNGVGQTETEARLASLRAEGTATFTSAYGIASEGRFDIGGDLPLYGPGFFSGGQDFFFAPNYIVGTLTDDLAIRGFNPGENGFDISYDGSDTIHAGRGDDTIIATLGSDLVDGGLGIDTLDYRTTLDGLFVLPYEVFYEDVGGIFYQQRLRVEYESLSGLTDFTDLNYGIETLILGRGGDTININSTVGGVTINGFEGDDTFIGATDGSVSIIGGAGTDTYVDNGASDVFIDLIENFQQTSNSTGGSNASLDNAIGSLLGGFGFALATDAGSAFAGRSLAAPSTSSVAIISGSNAPRGLQALSTAVANGTAEIKLDIYNTFTLDAGADGTPDFTIGQFNWSDLGFYLEAGREDIAVIGSSENDRLFGTRDADLIVGAEGDDLIKGRRGNDEISGEQGDDRLFGNGGNDDLYGDRGEDYVNGGWGNDRLWGGADNDRLIGSFGNDQLSGGFGDDRLFGGSGRDFLIGGDGADRLDGGWGRDTADYSGSDEAVTVDLEGSSPGRWWWHKTHGTGAGGEAEGDRLHSIEDVIGSVGDDSLLGNRFANALTGGAGDDIINGRRGNDTLEGGQGDDVLTGGRGKDTFVFSDGDGEDTITDFETGSNHGWFWRDFGYHRDGDRLSINMDGFETVADILSAASQSGDDTVFDFGNGDVLTLLDTDLSRIGDNDFLLT